MTDIRRRASRVAFENQWLRLRVDEIEYADGTPGSYSVIEKTDFTVVLPFQDGGFWLVKEYLNLSVTETMKSWSICETIISFAGLGFALLASLVI